MNEDSRVQAAKYALFHSNTLYKKYEWLIDSYVLDFFTGSHWGKLPSSWREYLERIDPETLGSFLNNEENCLHLAPLSLLALRALVRLLEIPRKISSKNLTHAKNDLPSSNKLAEDHNFAKLFWKRVKMKKRHEITNLAQFTYKNALKTNCSYIVDVGSGLGHLSRMLAYFYGLTVCGIEAQNDLVEQAKKLDKKFEIAAAKYNLIKHNRRPVHLNMKVSCDLKPSEFLQMVKNAFAIRNDDFVCGIVGLHPCGDLGPRLLQLYKICPNVRFINIVSCCYMKMSTQSDNQGYPLSHFCIENKFNLSYNAREIACHAVETYTNRLKNGWSWELKIHAYRAALEILIAKLHPNLRYMPVSNVKYIRNMTFSEYCTKALKKYNVTFEETVLESEEIKKHLSCWKNVVTFYSIRLMFGPLIESMILLDRFLYIEEDGYCNLNAVFDPNLSSRNHVLSANKL